jgi:hypothetical protein
MKSLNYQILLILTIILSTNVKHSSAAFEKKFFGSRYIGSGYTGIASNLARFPTLNNSANLNDIETPGVHLHGQDFYGIKPLYLAALDMHAKLWSIPCGVGTIQYGNDNYKELTIKTGFGKDYGNLKIGITINFHSLQIRNYGETNTLGFSVGCNYRIHNKVLFGMLLDEFNQPSLGSSGEKIPQCFIVGFELLPEKDTRLRMDIMKSSRDPFTYHFGMEYNLNNKLLICFGYREKIDAMTCGIVLSYFRLEVGYAMNYHLVLGVSNTISFGYEL